MNLKKAMVVIMAVAMIGSSLAGCTSKPIDATTEPATTSTVATTQAPSEESTQASTDASSEESSTESTTASTTAASTTTSTTKANISTGTTKAPSTTKKAQAASTTKQASTSTTVSTTKKPDPIKIVLKKNGKATCNSSNVTISPAKLSDPQGTVYIEKGGDYLITSDTDVWHGQIIVKLKNTEKADIRIENVSIVTSKANAIRILDTNITAERSFIEADVSSTNTTGIDTDSALRDEMKQVSKNDKAPNVSLSFPTGTSSSFNTNANSLSGVVYNESKLTIKGNGKVKLTATNNRNNVICSTKSVTFKNVAATLETAATNSTSALGSARGIFSFSSVKVESGSLNIKSNGDCIRCDDYSSAGGKTTLYSSAADGIDADDAIIITAGTVKAVALDKSSFKVRRINNQERIKSGDTTVQAKDGVVDKTKHTFKIDGGTVTGESKNITTVQGSSKQASITCRSIKRDKSTGSALAEMSKTPVKFSISGLKVKSANVCIKYLYSSASVKTTGSYKVSAENTSFQSENVTFKGTVGTAEIYTAQAKS